MAKKRAKSGEVPVWEITRIKKTPAAYLGRVSAQTAEQAIEEWLGSTIWTHCRRIALRRGG